MIFTEKLSPSAPIICLCLASVIPPIKTDSSNRTEGAIKKQEERFHRGSDGDVTIVYTYA